MLGGGTIIFSTPYFQFENRFDLLFRIYICDEYAQMFFCVFLPGIMGNDVTCRGNVMEFYYQISAGTLLT